MSRPLSGCQRACNYEDPSVGKMCGIVSVPCGKDGVPADCSKSGLKNASDAYLCLGAGQIKTKSQCDTNGGTWLKSPITGPSGDKCQCVVQGCSQ